MRPPDGHQADLGDQSMDQTTLTQFLEQFALAQETEQSSEIWICRKDIEPLKVGSLDDARFWVATKIQGEPGQKLFRYIGNGAYEWASYVVGTREAVEAQGFCVNQVANND